MNAEQLLAVEQALGAKLSPALEGSISNLTQVPEHFIQVARQLDRITSYVFLRYLTAPAEHRYLPAFIEEIVGGKQAIATWGIGQMLLPSFAAAELVSREVSAILAAVKPRPGEKWVQVRPTRRKWDNGVQSAGSPGIFRPELDYRYRSGAADCVAAYIPKPGAVQDIDDAVLATRRWIASRFAAAAADKGVLGVLWEPDELIHATMPGTIPSLDSLIAIKALVAEEKAYPKDGESVPGFRGPTDWFVG